MYAMMKPGRASMDANLNIAAVNIVLLSQLEQRATRISHPS